MRTLVFILLLASLATSVSGAVSDITTTGTIEGNDFTEGGSDTLTNDISGNAASATTATSASDLSCTNCVVGSEVDESTLSGTAASLTVGNLSCTDCLTSAEISDLYLLNSGDTASSEAGWNFDSNTFTIAVAGPAGIGTNTPTEELQLDGQMFVTGGEFWFNETDQSGVLGLWRLYAQEYKSNPAFYLDQNNATARDFSDYHNILMIDSSGSLLLGGAGRTGDYAITMTITPNAGAVGFGTTGPGENLDLESNDVDEAIQFEVLNGSAGPNSGSSFEDDNTVGTVEWDDPSFAETSDDSDAVALSDGISHYLKVTGFGFNLPSNAQINGILVEIEKQGSQTAGHHSEDSEIKIIKGGTIGSTNKGTTTYWPASDTYVSHGNSTDLWGETWTASDINDVDFGVAISANTTDDPCCSDNSANVDHVRMTIYYDINYTLGLDDSDSDKWKIAASDALGTDDVITINSSGAVGINTDTPEDFFHVNGSIQNNPDVMEIVAELTYTDAEFDYIAHVAISGGYLYAASWTNDSLSIIDISEPTNPRLISSVVDSTYYNQVISVDVAGKYVYTLSAASKWLTITDVSDPSDPVIVGYTDEFLNNPRSVKVVGPYAYTAENNYELNVFDISDPTNPEHINNLTENTDFENLWPLYIHGNYAYVGSTGRDRVVVVNITNPFLMNVLDSIQDDQLNDTRDLIVRGNYLYATANVEDRLTIINITDPEDISILTSLQDSTYLNGAMNIELYGDWAIVQGNPYVTAVDISDPANPFVVGSVSISGTSRTEGMKIEGDYAYVAEVASDTLNVIDLKGLKTHAASIGALESTDVMVVQDMDVDHDLTVHNSLIVGPRGIFMDGDLSVKGKAYGVLPRMYLTESTHAGNHNCDDYPMDCCKPGYHMCTTTEFLVSGREIELSGDDRDTDPYNVAGLVDPVAESTARDCNGWTSVSASDEYYYCSYSTSTTCSISALIAGCDTGSFRVWCCSD